MNAESTASPLSSPTQPKFLIIHFRSAMEDEIELKTAPADFRFPTTNQTRHCFTRYIEFHRCTTAKGEDANECERFAKYYRALCPGEWVDKWNEQRETGTFPGPL
jgi:cytochrome c oxidase subunit 6b